MNIDLDELEKLAKAASAKDALSFDEEDFAAYITPEIVCELINRLREAEKDDARLQAIISNRWAINNDNMPLYSYVMDMTGDQITDNYLNPRDAIDAAMYNAQS